ncbi:unnamed protein product [Camellia sinensis]
MFRQQSYQAPPLQNHYLQLSYGELLQATNGFSPDNLIGDGGYGSVYKGILNFGEQIIAVKHNILLDGDLCAHVSDFGLAKIFSAITGLSYRQQSSSIGIRSIVGYVAPVVWYR